MTHSAPVERHADWVERSPIARFLRHSGAIAAVELDKLVRDPTEILTRAVQPALWLIVFGEVFTRTRVIPTGSVSYLDFMAPGVLAQSVLFTAIFYGIAVIWERDLGIVHKLLVSPASRGALVFGKSLAAGLRALTQAVIIILLTLALGVHVQLTFLHLAGIALVIVLGGALFSTFSFVIACLVKTRERFMGIGQVLTMPLFFASNAIYPLSMMPSWLERVARFNPLTYLVSALRVLMLPGEQGALSLTTDLGVLALVFALLVVVGARLYPGIAR
ncbi:MAG TPA: ABC transporter permease [Gemmatimonadaceae bacterium]